MTKIISFGCAPTDKIYLEQVLPATLSKRKVSTIRPAWKIIPSQPGPVPGGRYMGVIIDKEPRFKVGEPVKFLWKCRSPYKWFCSVCGGGLMKDKKDFDSFSNHQCIKENLIRDMFPKILGTGTITKLFKIELDVEAGIEAGRVWMNGQHLAVSSLEEFCKLDGFASTIDFFTWFDQHYDLSSPKKFFDYRWRWD